MNRQRRFSVSYNYLDLKETVNTILEDSDDGLEYCLTIFPPEPSIITAEEEGSDDGQISSTLPNDIPGEIWVFIHNVDALSDSEDSSEDEPLAARRARIRPNIQTTTSKSFQSVFVVLSLIEADGLVKNAKKKCIEKKYFTQFHW
ncbi:hypothetical protein ACJJTC_017217 [Scirpophaga incertulas]